MGNGVRICGCMWSLVLGVFFWNGPRYVSFLSTSRGSGASGEICKMSGSEVSSLGEVLAHHTELLQPDLVTLKNAMAKLYLKEGSTLKQEKAHRALPALREPVEAE